MNARLAKFLRDPQGESEQLPQIKAELPSYQPTNWRIRDRISKQDIKDLVEAFNGGATTCDLTIHYGSDVRSVRRHLREEGAKKEVVQRRIDLLGCRFSLRTLWQGLS